MIVSDLLTIQYETDVMQQATWTCTGACTGTS